MASLGHNELITKTTLCSFLCRCYVPLDAVLSTLPTGYIAMSTLKVFYNLPFPVPTFSPICAYNGKLGANPSRFVSYISGLQIWTEFKSLPVHGDIFQCLLHTKISISQSQLLTAQWRIRPAYSRLTAVASADPFPMDGWVAMDLDKVVGGRVASNCFNASIQHKKQFVRNWQLPCCHCTETCSHVFIKIISIDRCQWLRAQLRIIHAYSRLAAVPVVWYISYK